MTFMSTVPCGLIPAEVTPLIVNRCVWVVRFLIFIVTVPRLNIGGENVILRFGQMVALTTTGAATREDVATCVDANTKTPAARAVQMYLTRVRPPSRSPKRPAEYSRRAAKYPQRAGRRLLSLGLRAGMRGRGLLALLAERQVAERGLCHLNGPEHAVMDPVRASPRRLTAGGNEVD